VAENDGEEQSEDQVENSDDDITQMKAKFNRLLANFEKEEF